MEQANDPLHTIANERTVYVAGAFRDERIPGYIKSVRELPGFTVTHDWTLDRERSQWEAAVFDIEGVCACDVLVAVMDYGNTQYDYRGTFTELGAALGRGKRVIIVQSPDTHDLYARTNCFFHHPRIVYATRFDAALRLLSALHSPVPPRMLVLGHGGHGKDTLAEDFAVHGMKFVSSSMAACEKAVYPTLRERYNYTSIQQCFEDRRQHRVEWYELICAYNSTDKARLAKEIMQDNQIYVGMRDRQEFEASRSLFDLVVWVDASERLPEPDPSLFIARADADVYVPNNGTLREFVEKRINALTAFLFMPEVTTWIGGKFV